MIIDEHCMLKLYFATFSLKKLHRLISCVRTENLLSHLTFFSEGPSSEIIWNSIITSHSATATCSSSV